MSQIENHRRRARIALPLCRSGPQPCPYLPDRLAENDFTVVSVLDPAAYQELMNHGFRRSGLVVYKPVCRGCQECVALRVPVAAFTPSKSQRRVLRRNRDVTVEVGPPKCDDEKHRVYAAYLHARHDGTMSDSREDIEEFLYRSPTDGLEMVYRVKGRVVAVGILDACPDCLSSVYFFFDPAESRRSLGTFGVLCEIEECRRRGLDWWYAGFYIRGCAAMSYKNQFRPYELLEPDGRWTRHDAP